MYARIWKRLLDILLAGVALVVLALPMLLIGVAVKLDDPGPALFRQRRVGQTRDRQITYFEMWKFRSMKQDAPHDVPTHLLARPDDCMTRLGRWLRRTSLDELPQLVQVLTGRMSLVGPRPALWNESDLIAARELYGANDIRPGLTGWAQVNGRDGLTPSEKAEKDGVYAAALRAGHGRGLAMDLRCCLKTVVCVLRADGVCEGSRDESPADAQAGGDEAE